MEDFKVLSCMLCFAIIKDEDYEAIEDNARDALDSLLLKLDFDGYSKHVMCNVCSAKLYAAQKFKMACLYTDNIINRHVCDSMLYLDLRDIYMKERCREGLTDDVKVCRLCMQPINSASEFHTISEEQVNMLLTFVPEMNVFIVKEPVMCNHCAESLFEHCNFLKQCSDAEEDKKIDTIGQVAYVPSVPSVDIPIKLEDVGISVKIEDVYIEFEKDGIESIKTEWLDINCEVKFERETNSQEISEAASLKNKEMYKCENCNYAATHKQYLKKHQLIHKDPSEVHMYKCEICNFETKHKTGYKRHLLVHKDPSEVEIYKCQICNHETKHKTGHKRHLLVHKDLSEVQLYKCEHCNYETRHRQCLKSHMMIHKDPSEVQMYKCEYCNFETKRRRDVRRHMLIHSDRAGLQTYKCECCSYETKNKGNFKIHVLIHKSSSEVQMYKCEHCNYEAKFKSYVKKHMIMHKDPSEVQMYICANCNFETKNKNTLKLHMSKHKDVSKVQMDMNSFKKHYVNTHRNANV